MIELELQALSLSREGLLMDVGRTIAACGFALVRQRLADDPHGVLLTMVVRGAERQQRQLEKALDAHERIVSFAIAPFVAGPPKPHFAASRAIATHYVPPPAPVHMPVGMDASTAAPPKATHECADTVAAVTASTPPLSSKDADLELEEFLIPVRTVAPAPTSVPAPEEPFVDAVPLEADVTAVEKLLPALIRDYPRVFPLLHALEESIEQGARESTLQLAGQRLGAWLFGQNHVRDTRLSINEAVARVGMPALSALVEVTQTGDQLDIRNSPLCTEQGRSGCKFLSGYLEGLLGPVVAPQTLSVFALACRSCGAGECILAVMD